MKGERDLRNAVFNRLLREKNVAGRISNEAVRQAAHLLGLTPRQVRRQLAKGESRDGRPGPPREFALDRPARQRPLQRGRKGERGVQGTPGPGGAAGGIPADVPAPRSGDGPGGAGDRAGGLGRRQGAVHPRVQARPVPGPHVLPRPHARTGPRRGVSRREGVVPALGHDHVGRGHPPRACSGRCRSRPAVGDDAGSPHHGDRRVRPGRRHPGGRDAGERPVRPGAPT